MIWEGYRVHYDTGFLNLERDEAEVINYEIPLCCNAFRTFTPLLHNFLIIFIKEDFFRFSFAICFPSLGDDVFNHVMLTSDFPLEPQAAQAQYVTDVDGELTLDRARVSMGGYLRRLTVKKHSFFDG